MTLQVALTAPTLIRPDNLAVYCLDGRTYKLMNGTGLFLVAHLVNSGTAPATVTGCISSLSRTITIDAGEAYMMGWSPRDTTWRMLRVVEARIVGLDGTPPDAHLAPPDADVPLLVEDLDGTAARIPLSAIAAYLVGDMLTLAVCPHFSPA